MIDSASRRGAANLTPVLMILAFALIAGFLVWLGMTSEGTEPVAMTEEDTGAETADSVELGATGVSPDELQLNPDSYEGQTVRVASSVASGVGSEAFFLDLPQSPFLVKMDSALVASGRGVPPGDADVTVTGTLRVMTDSIVSAWAAAGVISEADRPLVEFASHFIEASRVRGGGQAPSGADGGGGGGGGGEQGN